MNLRELLETAHLDALGLLDEQEQREFEAAFMAADPAVRAQVRAEQARWARTADRLSDENPPAALRSKVVERVMAAIASEAPIPELALTRSNLPYNLSLTTDAEVGTPGGRKSALAILGLNNRVSPLWRAVSIGCATAAMVCLGVLFYQLEQTRQIGERNVADRLIGEMSGGFGASKYRDVMFAAATKRAVFTSLSPSLSVHAQASIYLNPDWEGSMLAYSNLPPAGDDEVYRIVLVNERNEILSVATEFKPENAAIAITDLTRTFTTGNRIAIALSKRAAVTSSQDLLMVATIG
jgi:hypothetical protein